MAAVAVFAISALLLNRTAPRSTATTAQSARSTPDLSGVWMERDLGGTFAKDAPPLQPWADERTKANLAAGPEEDPEMKCFPSGLPRIYLHRYPIEILQLPGRVILFFEYDHVVRQIWTDGRKHPKEGELDDTWMGHSIGSWDGDALVVDTIGFNNKTWLDNAGHPHSDALHVVERIRRMDHDTLQIDFTFDDPKAYTKPWTGQKVFRLRPGWEITEQVCADNFLWKEPGK
jgi:hypothetical protein